MCGLKEAILPSFIALIPKIESPVGINEFRPISLVGRIYKTVSKILSKRLKMVQPKWIDVNRFAFLGGRNMLDSVMIVNEVVDEAKKKKKPTLTFKLDYEKAYDSVRWDFLLYMLHRINFCSQWINLIKGC